MRPPLVSANYNEAVTLQASFKGRATDMRSTWVLAILNGMILCAMERLDTVPELNGTIDCVRREAAKNKWRQT